MSSKNKQQTNKSTNTVTNKWIPDSISGLDIHDKRRKFYLYSLISWMSFTYCSGNLPVDVDIKHWTEWARAYDWLKWLQISMWNICIMKDTKVVDSPASVSLCLDTNTSRTQRSFDEELLDCYGDICAIKVKIDRLVLEVPLQCLQNLFERIDARECLARTARSLESQGRK